MARLLSLLLAVGALVLAVETAGASATPLDATVRAEALAQGDTLLLATEADPPADELDAEGEGEEAPGLEPRDADNSENEFAPENYEANFLWGAAVGLLVIVLAVVGAIGAAWYLLVVRPNQTPTRT